MDMKVDSSVECSDCEMLEIRPWEKETEKKSKITVLDFKRADFGLLRDLLGTVLQDKGLGWKGTKKAAL